MHKLAVPGVITALIASAFVAGIAVGKGAPPTPKFTAAEEIKWDDMNGLKLGTLVGDYKKGPYGALLKIPAGYTSPLHTHSGAYEAVQISGTSSHWLKGEDGTKAKKMTPGSYWTIPAKLEHVSSCAAGAECIMFIWQKTKFDAAVPKDAMGSGGTASAGSGAGSAAKAGMATGSAGTVTGAGAGSAAKPGTVTGAGAGSGAKPGTAAGAAAPKATTPPASGAGAKAGTPTPGAGSGAKK